MKIAISLPDDLFERADQLARRLSVSRSELYRRAVRSYLARHEPGRVTEALDEVCEDLGADARTDPFVDEAGRRLLEREDW